MPSGARVQVDVYYWGMNIFVTGLPRDAGRTFGLCGNYDGNPNNDLRDHRTDQGYTLQASGHPIEFIKNYK